jgi:N-acetylglucosaminyl-diphospho-decaprenol L-rhamnosyltransferase
VNDLESCPPPSLPGPAAGLTVIIVNYNAWPEVERLVAELRAEAEFRAGRFQIVVVDNASEPPVPDEFRDPVCPGVRVLLMPDNGGFAVGVNAGWRSSRSPWLLILNPDVEIEGGMTGHVFERIDEIERRSSRPPGIIGFGLSNPDGSPQGSVGVFPSLFRTLREQFIPRSRRKYQANWRIRSGPVDWVTGACMLVNREMMAELDGMDEDFFLYYEEVAFSRSAQDRGWGVEYDGGVKVIHRYPLQDRAVSPKMRVITRHSKLLYFRKHLPGWQFLGLSWFVTLEAACRGSWAALRGRIAERRAWRSVDEISSRLRAGAQVKGREVRRIAEAVEREEHGRPALTNRPHQGPERSPSTDGRLSIRSRLPPA